MQNNINLGKRCGFKTERLLIKSWQQHLQSPKSKIDLIKIVRKLLTPQVTEALPRGWQTVDTQEKALNWIQTREEESSVFLIVHLRSEEIIGLLFLNEIFTIESRFSEIKLGYLISEKFWRKGLGSELIGGLAEWSRRDETVKMLSGGVEEKNIASLRVLQKNGFIISKTGEGPQSMLFLEKLISN